MGSAAAAARVVGVVQQRAGAVAGAGHRHEGLRVLLLELLLRNLLIKNVRELVVVVVALLKDVRTLLLELLLKNLLIKNMRELVVVVEALLKTTRMLVVVALHLLQKMRGLVVVEALQQAVGAAAAAATTAVGEVALVVWI